MANVDNPRGLWPIRKLGGEPIVSNPYTASGTIYIGDPVIAVNTGTVTVAAATNVILGIAATYAVSGGTVQVYDDPFIVFGIQATTGQTPALTDIFGTCDMIAYATGSTTTKVSIMELDAITTGSNGFKVLNKVSSPDNAWGEHVDLEVLIYEHFLGCQIAANVGI